MREERKKTSLQKRYPAHPLYLNNQIVEQTPTDHHKRRLNPLVPGILVLGALVDEDSPMKERK